MTPPVAKVFFGTSQTIANETDDIKLKTK